jgi:deazaflavin-dependent oxidoreductase (nitroreductase family)
MEKKTKKNGLPGWLKPANKLVLALQRLGLPMGTIHVLSVPGRKSGELRTTPVSLMTVDGERYIVGGLPDADWVKNVQAASWGILRYGRKQERVALVELSIEERAPVLSQFPTHVPQGVAFFQRLYDIPKESSGWPEAFAKLAPTCPVFRLEKASSTPATPQSNSNKIPS